MFKALLELYVGSIEGGSEQVNAPSIERVFERAAEIVRLVLDSGPRGTRAEIAVDEIVAMDRLGGGRASERAIRRNRHSIASFGLLNPLVVREEADCFQLLQGRARLEACRRMGLGEVTVVVKEVGDTEAVELSLLDILLGNGASHVDPDCIRALLRFYARPSCRTMSHECTGAASRTTSR